MLLTMTGTLPLIMHNAQSADPMNRWAKEIKKLTDKKRNMTDSDQMELARIKFYSGLYYNDEIGPYLPAANVFRCLIEAGSMTREGKKIERGVGFMGVHSRLEYDGPRKAADLWGDGTGKFVDRRLAAVNRVRIPVTRPIFPEWSAQFEVTVDDQVLDPEQFVDIATKAGRAVGVGDYRRFYGRFSVEITG